MVSKVKRKSSTVTGSIVTAITAGSIGAAGFIMFSEGYEVIGAVLLILSTAIMVSHLMITHN